MTYIEMPTFNSCTERVGCPGIIHDHSASSHPVYWAWMTSQLNVSFIRKLRGSLICLTCLLTYSPSVLVQPGTGGGPVNWCRN